MLFLCIFASLSGYAFGQKENTGLGSKKSSADSASRKNVVKTDPRWQSFSEIYQGIDTLYKWDSTFDFVQRYDKIKKTAKPYLDLGLNASPQKFLMVNPFVDPGFQTGFNLYPVQNKNPENLLFYKAKVPFTRFVYTQGGKGVFILNAYHTQNISPNWNVSVDFSSAQNGPDIYTGGNMGNLHRGTMLGSHFKSRNGRYTNIVIASWNRARRSENWGLSNGEDSSFFVPSDTKFRITGKYTPFNSTASSVYATHNHVMLQKLYLGSQKKLYFFMRNDWKKERYYYKEKSTSPDSIFYGKNEIFNKGAFADSIVWIQLNNEAGISNNPGRDNSFPLLWKLSYSEDRIVYNSIYKTAADINYNQGVHAMAQWDPYKIKKIQFKGFGDYYFAGINQGDMRIEASAGLQPFKNMNIGFGAKNQTYTAPFFYNKFTSNYILYNNTLGKVKATSVFGSVNYKMNHFIVYGEFNSGTADNAIYADTGCRFKQTSGLNYINVSGGINIHAGHWYLDDKFCFQNNNKMGLMPMPKYSNYFSVYYQGFLFKKAMYARIGLDIWIQGKYTGYKYNPELATFFPAKISAGNYPVGDVFLSGQIKTVELFFKFEHINSNLTNYGYNPQFYSAIGYPIESFRLRIGVNWKFYN